MITAESVQFYYNVAFGVLFGFCGILLFYIIRQFSADDKKETGSESKNECVASPSNKKKETATSGKPKKQRGGVDSRWSNRSEKQQAYKHPWLLTTLKGHEGQLKAMDFASNGKYLVSGAEDPDPGGEDLNAPGEKDNNSPSSVSSSASSSSSSSSSSADPSPRNSKGLSRRQRKNRRRDDVSPPETKKKPKPKRPEANLSKKLCGINVPLKQYGKVEKMNLSKRDLAMHMRMWMLSPDEMLALGYPMESSVYPGKALILKRSDAMYKKETRFDVNAQEFVPGFQVKLCENGRVSGSSSESGENLEDSEESTSGSDQDITDVERDLDLSHDSWRSCGEGAGGSAERKCCRCGRGFFIADNREYLTQEKCYYHWGKLCTQFGNQPAYTCCQGFASSQGCTSGKVHVWTGLEEGCNGPFGSYVKTRPARGMSHGNGANCNLYALDCEMCFTARGLEVAKVTVVNVEGRLVYDSFVRPECEIVDYNTRFSGITAKDMGAGGKRSSNTPPVKALRDVQNDLMGFIRSDTILVGHGLENDLRALRIMHFACVDTAVAFPHHCGFPFRRSLKSITSSYLRRDIQTNSSGHNSYEDAVAAMELMLWLVRKHVTRTYSYPYQL